MYLKWDYIFAVECQALALPSSGTFLLSNNGSHTIANFSCVDNYYIKGKHALFCGPSGTWDESAPSCGMYTAKSQTQHSLKPFLFT